MIIVTRKQIVINTDPQRRCYYGVNAKEELVWTSWAELCDCTPENAEARLKFWRDLNAYSVSVGGRPSEYKVAQE